MNSVRLNVKGKPNSLKREFEEQLVGKTHINNNKLFFKCITRNIHSRNSVAPVYEDGTKELENLRSFQKN